MGQNKTNPKRTIQIISCEEYCNNKVSKFNMTFRITQGMGTYVENGMEVTIDEIEARYPTPQKLTYNESIEGNSSWKQGK